MKNLLKYIITSVLALAAKAVVRRYRPRIVMVTGSVGKTSTKDAVAVVLASSYLVRKSAKSFNSEFGVPFTIFDVPDPHRSLIAWLGVVKQAFALLFLPNHYPTMLVLEVGAERPGDLARILRMATPDAVVVTRLPEIPVHVEAYASPAAVREEEFSPAYALAPQAPLILSADDPHSLDGAARTSARVFSYGITEGALVRVLHPAFCVEGGSVVGMHMTVLMGGVEERVVVRGSVGVTQLLPVAAALATAIALEIPAAEALRALESYEPPPGRGRLLKGVHESVIVDDTYNASPAAVEEALTTLKAFPMRLSDGGRRIAILGDMLELGRYSAMEHERVGALACKSADLVVAVGIRARAYVVAPCTAEVMTFDNAAAAAAALPALIKKGDVILVKGSQSIRTERVVEALLASPADASLLVRQDSVWKRRT